MADMDRIETLIRTGPGTIMGNYLRRYWVPALLETELPRPRCAPVRVKLMGEELVGFRDENDRIALVQEWCPHRGASLFFGRNEGDGLRCSFHGWMYDVSGQCIDMPSEPEQSRFKERIKVTSYPCEVRGGVIWAYMGPQELRPPLPELEWSLLPESHRYVSKRVQESNYLQVPTLSSSDSPNHCHNTLIQARPLVFIWTLHPGILPTCPPMSQGQSRL